MSQNWMRHFELQLIDDKGDGISLSDFKVTFNIQKMPATIFNGFVGNFKIYNLSPETQNRIMGKEFTRVRAIAGYNGTADSSGNYPDKNVGIIFNGDIRFTVTGKDNVTDSWVLIQCIDGWEGHLNASVKTTVSAGWKHADLFDLGMQSLSPYGITEEAGRILVQLYSPAAALFIRTLDALCTALQGSARLTGGTKTTSAYRSR